jgi:hypothetical protein
VPQQRVVLVLRQVLADVAVEVTLDLQDVGALTRELDDLAQAVADLGLEQDRQLVLVVEVEVRGAEISEGAWGSLTGDVREGCGARLGLRCGRQDEVMLLDEVVEGAGEGVAEGEIAERLGDPGEAEVLAVATVDDLERAHTGDAAEHRGQATWHAMEDLRDLGEYGYRVQILERRAGAAAVALQGDDDEVRGGIATGLVVSVLDRGGRDRRLAQLERGGGAGEHVDAAQREEGEDPGGDSVIGHVRGHRRSERGERHCQRGVAERSRCPG